MNFLVSADDASAIDHVLSGLAVERAETALQDFVTPDGPHVRHARVRQLIELIRDAASDPTHSANPRDIPMADRLTAGLSKHQSTGLNNGAADNANVDTAGFDLAAAGDGVSGNLAAS